jgi:hypothetical protein
VARDLPGPEGPNIAEETEAQEEVTLYIVIVNIPRALPHAGTSCSTLHSLSYLIFVASHEVSPYYPHFTHKKTKP